MCSSTDELNVAKIQIIIWASNPCKQQSYIFFWCKLKYYIFLKIFSKNRIDKPKDFLFSNKKRLLNLWFCNGENGTFLFMMSKK